MMKTLRIPYKGRLLYLSNIGASLKQKYIYQMSNTDYMYRIDHAKEWVMRLYNPRVCGYPEAKPRDKCKQVGYSA